MFAVPRAISRRQTTMTGGELRNKIDEFLFLLTKQLLHTRRRDEEGIGELVMESNLQNACIRHSSRHSLDSKIYSFRKSKKKMLFRIHVGGGGASGTMTANKTF